MAGRGLLAAAAITDLAGLPVLAGPAAPAAVLAAAGAANSGAVPAVSGAVPARLGFYDELHATPELVPWLLSMRENRIDAAQLLEIESIAYGQSGPPQ